MNSRTLALISTALEVEAGDSVTTNASESGYWLRIATALEDLAGASTAANATFAGYLKRAALAAEAIGGTSGTDENANEAGYLKRIVDALEVGAGVTEGSLLERFYQAVLNGGAGGGSSLTIPQITTLSGGRSAALGVPDSYWTNQYLQYEDSDNHPHLGPFTWTAIKDGNWSDPTVWDLGTVPTGKADPSIYTVIYDLTFASTPIGALYADVAALRTAYRNACNTLVGSPADAPALAVIAAIEGATIPAIHNSSAGTFKFSDSVDTFLLVDTIVCHGTFECGTEADPVTAHIMFCGTADPTTTVKVGLMTMGRLRMFGQTKTPYVKFSIEPTAAATSVTLDEVPVGWALGDEIVVTSTTWAGTTGTDSTYSGPTTAAVPENAAGGNWTDYLEQKNSNTFKLSHDERRTITGIAGNVVSFTTPLAYNHLSHVGTEPGNVIEARCANLTRSVLFESLYNLEKGVAGTGRHRAHTMHMHHDDAVRKYAEFRDMGRSRIDPSLFVPSVNTTTQGMRVSLPSGAFIADPNNVRGRYAVHDHWTGPFFYRRPVISEGLSIWSATVPTPGWAYTQHHSRSLIDRCVTFNTRGAGFASELGSEIGQWTNNLSIWNRSDGYGVPGFGGRAEYVANHNGHAGIGFENQSRAILLRGNIAVSSRWAWLWLGQKTPDSYLRSPDHRNLRVVNPVTFGQTDSVSNPAYGQADMLTVYGHEQAQIPGFHDNECMDCTIGFQVAHRDSIDEQDVIPMLAQNNKIMADTAVNISNYSHNYYFRHGFFRGQGVGTSSRAIYLGTKSQHFNFAGVEVKGYSHVLHDDGGYNYMGFLVDTITDAPTFSIATTHTPDQAATLMPDYGIMGPWTITGGANNEVRTRDYTNLTSADMPQPYPIAPYGPASEPSPGTPKPYFVLLDSTHTTTPSQTQTITPYGTLVDSWGLRHWPAFRRYLDNGGNSYTLDKAKNEVATGTILVERNGCYNDAGTWKMRLWFVDADRGTHEWIYIGVDVTLTGFDSGFLALHEVADADANKPDMTLLPEESTYSDTPSSETTVQFSADFTEQLDVEPSTIIESNEVIVVRLGRTETVAVTITGGEYSQNGGAYTSTAGTAEWGDTFTVRNTTSSTLGSSITPVLTVGGTSATFTATVRNFPATGTMARDYFEDQGSDQNLDVRSGWELLSGTANTLYVDAATDALTSVAVASQTAIYRRTTDLADPIQFVEFNVFTNTFTGLRHLVSMSDASNWVGFHCSATNIITVSKCVAGTITTVNATSGLATFVAGMTIRGEYNATTAAYAIYVGGVSVLSGTVSSPPPSATRQGLRIVATATATRLCDMAGFGTGTKNSFGDNFTRSAENLEASANWTLIAGTPASLGVSSNQLHMLLSSVEGHYRAPSRGYDRVSVSATFNSGAGYLCVQYTDEDNWIGLSRVNTTQVRVSRCVAGTITSVHNPTVTTLGSANRVMVEYDPATGISNIRRDFKLVGTATIASGDRPPTSQYGGVFTTGGSGQLIDNFLLEAF